MTNPEADAAVWNCTTTVERYENTTDEEYAAGAVPTEVQVIEGNILTYGGVSNLWECLIGNGTGTAAQTLTFFNNGNAALGVGDSATAAAAGDTDLVAATNKLRKGMEATYPLHTSGTSVGSATITFRSVFQNADANWAWAECVIANSATLATGRILNRKVEALGTKTNTAVWTLTVTVSIA